MASWHCFLLLFATSVSSSFDVRRNDDGDYFIWFGNNDITCEEFSDYTATYDSKSSRCRCNNPLTFSTDSSTCKNFTHQVYYRLDRSNYHYQLSDTSVSTVHAKCEGNNVCALKSTVTGTEQAVMKSVGNEPLNSNSNCVVNFVEILHDCTPRRINLNLHFQSHSDHKLYLKLRRTSPSLTTKLKGELFIVDITCAADGAYNKKMMFKYSGTSHLDEPGSFSDVPAYNPSKRCSDVAKTTSATFLPAATREPNHAYSSNSRDTDIEVGVSLGVIIILVAVVIISCITYRRRNRRAGGYRRQNDQNQGADPRADGDVYPWSC